MERERLRQERLSSSRKPWQTPGWSDSLRRPERLAGLGGLGGLGEELISISELLQSDQRRLSEFSRLGGVSSAFSVSGAEEESGERESDSQLISGNAGGAAGAAGSDSCDAMLGPRTQERIIPITIDQGASQQARERIIPVMVESDSSTELYDSSSTQSNDSTPCEEEIKPSTAFSSLLNEMKISEPLIKPGRAAFHHPSFANHFGFARLRQQTGAAHQAGGGLRDSFPGFPSFGNFPSFTPLLQAERQFPSHLRDKSRAAAIHKQRLAKSKSSVDSVDCNPPDKPAQSFR